MPALEALKNDFADAHTQVLGLSIDSVYCHANWGASLGGVSFPLLSDFHPKGAVADSFGLYLADKGITDRATVFIDAEGMVQLAESVTPAGKRDIGKLLDKCRELDEAYGKPLPGPARGKAVPPDTELFIKSNCGFSRAALLARDNLRLGNSVSVASVTDDDDARSTLEQKSGATQAPCLVFEGATMLESKDIVAKLVDHCAPI